MATWSDGELRAALRRFEQEHVDAGLRPTSVHSYVDYADRFLRWRRGDYRPRTAVGPDPAPRRGEATAEDLRADLRAYELELTEAHLQPAAVHTYIDTATRFVRWLEGTFVTRGPNARGVAGAPESGPSTDLSWAWEGSIQEALVRWLELSGWTVERQADTASGEHGVDILASRADDRLAVEVKGYPQATYQRGERAGQPKKWHPASQARTYFGNAIHTALVMRDSLPGAQIVVAFPDVPGYRALLDQVYRSLAYLSVRALMVRSDGTVLEPYGEPLRLPTGRGAPRLISPGQGS